MKKNRLSKVFVSTLSGALALATLMTGAGCGGGGIGGTNSAPDNAETIQVSYWKSGIGVDWLNNAKTKFEAEFPQYKVFIEEAAGGDIFGNTIKLTKDNTIDLYMTSVADSSNKQYYEPLDDVLGYTHTGESKTVEQKIDATVLGTMKFDDGKYYTLPYGGGLCSIAYNNEIINGEDYKVPNTTDELYDLAVKLKADGTTPFITFEAGGYWLMVYQTWMIQYNGKDWYYNTWLKFEDENGEPNKAMLLDNEKKTGRYQVLGVLEKILNPSYVVPGSASAKFTPQQTKFLAGSAAMMPNGTWLYNEMKKSMKQDGTFKFSMMKTPVLSAIRENTTTIENDRELSALITAIDAAGADKSAVALTGAGYEVNQADLDRVYEARNLTTSVHDENVCVIPNYSNAKEGAKEFLKFIYSDTMIREYMGITHMSFPAMPSDGVVDLTGWNSWEKDIYAMHQSSIQIPKFKVAHKVLGQAGDYAGVSLYNSFANTNSADRKTADQVWATMQTTYEENWAQYLYNAGYSK